MYYTIRSAGPKTKRELIQYYLGAVFRIVKGIFCICLLIAFLFAGLTRNLGAVAVITLTLLILGTFGNFLQMRHWLPGLGKGTWFARGLALGVYIFITLAILLIASPDQP